MRKGYTQIYTGNGKGKTTAAFGLALRASAYGKKIFIGQFVKGMKYGELDSIKKFSDTITLKQFGRDCFIENDPEPEDIKVAREGWDLVNTILDENNVDILILDEIGIAIFYRLIGTEEVAEFIKKKPPEMELILTGRYVPEELFELADLVTEMKEIKHYYKIGVQAREGIEL
ncbi:MAG: cob(I)yrinic acid a,c-diamide adenosyltransferase [Spirochaetia bacterium]|jgi:cob(I)alamin adenosyltransferase|nr:cob(I)yrinic acid a,c-diamide adenosyltransferase [Spirochaetia bacterium]